MDTSEQPLMSTMEVEYIKKTKIKETHTRWKQFKEFILGPEIQKTKRKVYLDGSVNPLNKQNNRIKNSKYNFITFLPIFLFIQFQQFTNLFYLALATTQFIPPLKVGFLLDYLGPLALVVSLSVLKELYDDIQRHKKDKSINNYQYKIFTKNGEQLINSGDLKVGMIIQINQNERIPADLLLLYADDEQGNVFIRTDQLDGETDWKLRKAVKSTQNIIALNKNPIQLLSSTAFAKCEQPTVNIYQFNGVFIWKQQEEQEIRESLSLENVVWQNTVLANGTMIGLVIQCGKETRMQMNSNEPKSKLGKIDHEINVMGFFLFVVMALLAGLITFLSGIPINASQIATTYIRYLILLSNIIPISMRVNLEFAKLAFSFKINIDKEIEGTITRNMNIPEQLGRIQYLLSDKTGTLTQNDMVFKKLSLQHITYTYENIPLMKSILAQQSSLKQDHQSQFQKKDVDVIFKEFIQAIILCHNVTPIYDEGGERSFQASSPDEIALVQIAEELGFILKKRDQNQIVILDMHANQYTFNILNNFPFSSDTKRMGIILHHLESDKYIFYLKGADTVMKQFTSEIQRGYIDEECENLAREGLRTLVVTQKELVKEDYLSWEKKFQNANQRLEKRELEVRKVINQLENRMEFLGITGVEDKLQEDICQTLENVRNAGINVWMLTGDKIETAICIAISSGIKSPNQEIFLIKEVSDESKLQHQLNQFETLTVNSILVIDGISLDTALNFHEKLFFQITQKTQSVVCCRCSPTQKAKVTECMRSYTKKVVACIGDGGNDVGMIQKADVGIGIEGKEGKQAALASDFSILKFKYINDLIFWHGRLSYKRSALLSQFVVHRGLIITVIQADFMIIFYFLSISIFSGGLMFGYATIFTMFPVFAIIFDEDVDRNIALTFTALYKTLQQGRDLNGKTVMIWWWKAIYSGTAIMMLALLLFKNIYLEIETVAFTSLIFYQYVMTLTELNSIHIVMIISNIGSALVYLLALYLFPNQLLVSKMNGQFFLHVFIIIMLSWVPLYLCQLLMKYVNPSDYQKIMKSVKRKKINTSILK